MVHDDVYGVVSLEENWVPTVAHILRRRVILDIFHNLPKGTLLEVGCGSGALLYDLNLLGFKCTGHDFSNDAIELATQMFRNENIELIKTLNFEKKFEYLLAVEVLEHNIDDVAVLREWSKFLVRGGKVLISVPAHQRLWGPSDEWAGHYRRYSREQLETTLMKAGFIVEQVVSYGYPLGNLLQPLRNYLNKLKLVSNKSTIELTKLSGVNRDVEKKYFWLYHNQVARHFLSYLCNLQRKYYDTDRGIGFIAIASKSK